MKTLLVNLKEYLFGFANLRTLKYKKGWGPWRFLPLYLIDYGSHVLTGGAVVSWSRWFYVNRNKYRLAGFMNRLLGHAQKNHGQLSGPSLWGTVDCPVVVRCSVCVGWAVLLLWSLR